MRITQTQSQTPGQQAQAAYEASISKQPSKIGPDTVAWFAADSYAKSQGYASAAEFYTAIGHTGWAGAQARSQS